MKGGLILIYRDILYINVDIEMFTCISFMLLQAIYPGAVATRMIKMTTPRYSAPSPETYSRLAVASIGVQDNAVVYWHHIIQVKML